MANPVLRPNCCPASGMETYRPLLFHPHSPDICTRQIFKSRAKRVTILNLYYLVSREKAYHSLLKVFNTLLTLKKSKKPTSGAFPSSFSRSRKKKNAVIPASSNSGFSLDMVTKCKRSSRLSLPLKNALSILSDHTGPGKPTKRSETKKRRLILEIDRN